MYRVFYKLDEGKNNKMNNKMTEFAFKAVIVGVVVGESYQDAIENVENPLLIVSIDKAKVKNIEEREVNDNSSVR